MKALLRKSWDPVDVIEWCYEGFIIELAGRREIVNTKKLAFTLSGISELHWHYAGKSELFSEFAVMKIKGMGVFCFTFRRIKIRE